MADTLEDWSADAQEAVMMSIVTPTATGSPTTLSTFQPKFTYSIFGDEERIFGYQNLKINLRFNANDMRPHLAVQYKRKFKAVGDTEPDDVKAALEEFLPGVAFQKASDYEAAIKSVPENWTPPGKKITWYAAKKKSPTYEIWKGSLADAAVKQLVSRVQVFVSFFIEGGTPLDVNEEQSGRWTVYFLYCKKTDSDTGKETYHFAGYSTVYTFYPLQLPSPPASPAQDGSEQPAVKDDVDLSGSTFELSQLPCRSRISQFVIIPPYQGKGNGSKFYNELYTQYLNHPQTVEITVEDPNEAFDDMRDVCDLMYLRTRPDFLNLKINTSVKIARGGAVPNSIVDPDAYSAVRMAVKIIPRQFARMVELNLMSQLAESVRPGIDLEGEKRSAPKPSKKELREYNLWRWLVKSRLYRQHKTILGQLDLDLRIEKLDETASSVEFEYVRLLDMYAARVEKARQVEDPKGKRKAVDGGEVPVSKKARVEETSE